MKRCKFALALTIFCLLVPLYASAKITFVTTDVLTTSYSNPAEFQLNVWVETRDSARIHPPDYISSIELEDPTGTIWPIDPIANWDEDGKEFWFGIKQSQFDGGVIPSGVYKFRVTDKTGKVITTTDVLSKADQPLPVPVITTPAAGEEIMTTTPDIRWTAGGLCKKFRITIDRVIGHCDCDNQTYYAAVWDWSDSVWTSVKYISIPKGILRPGASYRVRIEARYDYNDTDKRSRSDWGFFTVSPTAQ